MQIKKSIFLLAILIININSYSQDYFIVNKDTTFCSNLGYKTTAQGYLKSISYTATNGKEITIKKRKNVPDVETFYIDSIVRDKTPLKANKPNSYIRYTKRVVDGKLKVYLYYPYDGADVQRMSARGHKIKPGTSALGVYRFFLKMPDGTYYKINSKKNRNKYIIPFLNKCEKFKKKYTGTFSSREQQFIATIELYNLLCE